MLENLFSFFSNLYENVHKNAIVYAPGVFVGKQCRPVCFRNGMKFNMVLLKEIAMAVNVVENCAKPV